MTPPFSLSTVTAPNERRERKPTCHSISNWWSRSSDSGATDLDTEMETNAFCYLMCQETRSFSNSSHAVPNGMKTPLKPRPNGDGDPHASLPEGCRGFLTENSTYSQGCCLPWFYTWGNWAPGELGSSLQVIAMVNGQPGLWIKFRQDVTLYCW